MFVYLHLLCSVYLETLILMCCDFSNYVFIVCHTFIHPILCFTFLPFYLHHHCHFYSDIEYRTVYLHPLPFYMKFNVCSFALTLFSLLISSGLAC